MKQTAVLLNFGNVTVLQKFHSSYFQNRKVFSSCLNRSKQISSHKNNGKLFNAHGPTI